MSVSIEIGDSVYTMSEEVHVVACTHIHMCESDRRYICRFYMIVGTEGCVH